MDSKKFPISIMTNEDPGNTIKTLCKLKNQPINWESYKKMYEQLFNKNEKISSQHNDAHFYLVRQLGLIKKSNNVYRLSSTGKTLCNILSEPHCEIKLQSALASLLLTNKEKGGLFEEFLNFVRIPKTNDDLQKKFVGETYRTLKAWCLSADLIINHGKYYVAKPNRDSKKCTIEKFFERLLETYNIIQQGNSFEPKQEYVSVEEIKSRVSCELGFREPDQFDEWLTNVLEDKRYRVSVRLHGAPTHAYETMETFSYKGKSYVLLSIVQV